MCLRRDMENIMASATERLPVLVSKAQKAEIAQRAKEASLTMGEFLRRAAAAYRPAAEDGLLEGMLGQIKKSSDLANTALDRALENLAASEQRIAAMEHKPAVRKAATRKVRALASASACGMH